MFDILVALALTGQAETKLGLLLLSLL